MNNKRVHSLLIMLFVAISMMAQQPFGGCWLPDGIKDWSPEKDADAKFNRSMIALQPRISDTPIKANANQHTEGRVSACLTMNPMCSQTPSQGANNFIGYNPTYWQYMDILVWWGGSAGEGIIVPPSAPAVDAAHMHGVKVLGTIFFPPVAYGGQSDWVSQMLTKEGNAYPYAKKLYDIAAYYGFDGWFINEETSGGEEAWDAWVKYFRECAVAGGHPEMEIQWYDQNISIYRHHDMMKVDGASYFLNYGSATETIIDNQTQEMKDLGIADADIFKKLYFGIEVASGGIYGNGQAYKLLFPTTGHKGSIDLFNPEEPIWKQVVTNLLGTSNATGTQAYNAMNTVFNNEANYWTNDQHDPSNTSARNTNYALGFANCLVERSAIQSLPFVTTFSAGLGKYRFVNGEKRGTQDWYHRGMQEVLPTWRWWVDVPSSNKNDLAFNLNWDDAYNAGTSISVKGTLNAGVNYLTRLYRTNLTITSGCKFQLVYKNADASNIQLQLGVKENANAFTTFNISSPSTNNGWSVATVDLSSLAGKTVSVIALNFTSSSQKALDMKLGQLAIYPANYSPAALQISNLKVQNSLAQDGGNIRLTWDSPTYSDVHHYNIYFTRNGVKTLVGQTRDEGFYIDKFTRSSMDEKSVTASVTTVTKDMKEGNEISTVVTYPDLAKPNVKIKASKTLVKTNEEVTFTATADNYPTNYQWTIPAGAEKVSENGNKLVLKFTKEATYDITVAVTNQVGTTTLTIDKFVEVNAVHSSALANISAHKKIYDCSGSLSDAGEIPENIIDGVEVPGSIHGKWCIGGQKSHWVILDLEKSYKIYSFKIFDCGNKESYSDNFKNYKIWTSNDAKNWVLVTDETGRPESTKEDYVKPTMGRYVKLMPYDNDAPITIRIWEFEVFGIEGGTTFDVPSNGQIELKSNKNYEVSYALSEAQAANFKAEVTSSNTDIIEISNPNVDQTNHKITFTANAKSIGTADVKVSITNGEWVNEKSFNLEVINPDYKNVLSGKAANVSDKPYGADWIDATTTNNITDGNDNTTWASAVLYNEVDNVKADFDCGDVYKFSKVIFKANPSPVKIKVMLGETQDAMVQVAEVAPTTIPVTIALNDAKGRYITFLAQGQTQDAMTISEIEAYGRLDDGMSTMTIASGFNADIIAETTPAKTHSNAALDDQGWVLFGAGIQEMGGLPANGDVTSETFKVQYQLNDYTKNNAALMKTETSATLTLDKAQKANELYFLMGSSNGASEVSVTANYSDGTTADLGSITANDWFGDDEKGVAIYGLSRIGITTDAGEDNIDQRNEFRIYESMLKADPNKDIVSFTLTKKTGGYPFVLAVSKKSMSTGIADNLADNGSLLVYPNPVRNGESLVVSCPNAKNIQLVNMQGGTILNQLATGNTTKISISGIPQGIYMLIVTDNNGKQVSKVIVK